MGLEKNTPVIWDDENLKIYVAGSSKYKYIKLERHKGLLYLHIIDEDNYKYFIYKGSLDKYMRGEISKFNNIGKGNPYNNQNAKILIENNSTYRFLKITLDNKKFFLHITDIYGYKYCIQRSNFDGYLNGLQSSFEFVGIPNRYSIENIKLFIYLNNLRCELISNIYDENTRINLKFKCTCGNFFNLSWNNFMRNLKDVCNDCSQISANDKNRVWDEANLKTLVEENSDYFFIKFERIVLINKLSSGSAIYIHLKDKDGYQYRIHKSSFQKHIAGELDKFKYIDRNNPYAIDNIKVYLSVNKLPYEIESTIFKGSDRKLIFICKKHGRFERSWNSFLTYGICQKCQNEISDGISYPNKFMSIFFSRFNMDFDNEKTFEWSEGKRYDNYLFELSCITEAHGMQHYKDSSGNQWDSLKDIQENDEFKKQLAIENDIKNYIVLDCRYSKMEWIKNSIMKSELPRLLNFKESDIDWKLIHKESLKSKVVEVCKLWNSGIKNAFNISEICKISHSTAIEYLKKGYLAGLCDYDVFKNDTECNVKIICVTTKEIFNSISSASKKYNISRNRISKCCCSETYKSSGIHPVTGEMLIWMYYDKYITKGKNDIINMIKNSKKQDKKRQIICLTNGEVFNTIADASKKYHINCGSISSCCSKKIKYAGKDLDTELLLVWMYYEEYVHKSKEEIENILNDLQDLSIKTKVICLTTGEIFDSQAAAGRKYNCAYQSVGMCCRNKLKSAGKYLGKKLKWAFYNDEYIKSNPPFPLQTAI